MTVPLESLVTHEPLPGRSFIPTAHDEEAFETEFKSEEVKVESSLPLPKILDSGQSKRDFDRFMHKYERIERLFAWKFGEKGMKEYLEESKNTVPYLDIRRDLEIQEARSQMRSPLIRVRARLVEYESLCWIEQLFTSNTISDSIFIAILPSKTSLDHEIAM